MSKLRTPITTMGGKGRMLKKLRPFYSGIPHQTYVEVFGGGASVLFDKTPSPVEVLNDINGGLINMYRVIRNGGEPFARFYRMVCLTLYSREDFDTARHRLKVEKDPVRLAYYYYVIARMSFSGHFGNSWSSNVAFSRGGMASTCSAWLSMLKMLPEIHARLSRVQIECVDFERLIKRYDRKATLFYLDPPYVPSTRKKRLYQNEMSLGDHERLVACLLPLRGKAFLSGYRHPAYAPLEDAGWRRADYTVACDAVGRTMAMRQGKQARGSIATDHSRIESVWYNYSLDNKTLTQMRFNGVTE